MGTQDTKDATRRAVREQYGHVAQEGGGCCGPGGVIGPCILVGEGDSFSHCLDRIWVQLRWKSSSAGKGEMSLPSCRAGALR